MRFKEWLLIEALVHQQVYQKVPVLKLVVTDPKNIVNTLLIRYQKEADFQAKKGGVRNPAMVAFNVIRHDLINYDTVRDVITKMVSTEQLDQCDALKIRENLLDKLHELLYTVVEHLPKIIKIGKLDIYPNDLFDASKDYQSLQRQEINRELAAFKCGQQIYGRRLV